MLSKKFRKYITPAQRRKFMRLFKQKFSNQEYLLFLKKFRGSMLSRGRRSFSYKLFDKVRIFFKRVLKNHEEETKQRLDFDLVLRAAISNLIPILGTSNVRRGRRVQTVPVLLKLRKRIVLINK
jgi:ribosomal protein S7